MAEFHRGSGGGRFGGFKRGPGQKGPINRISPKLAGAAVVVPTAYTLSCSAGAYALAGVAALTAVQRKLSGAAGSYALAGVAATTAAQRKLSGAAGSYARTGNAAGVAAGRKLSGVAGSYALTGNAATLTKTAGSVAYTLACVAGSYARTGVAAQISAQRKMAGAAGAYAVSGISATLAATATTASAFGFEMRRHVPIVDHRPLIERIRQERGTRFPTVPKAKIVAKAAKVALAGKEQEFRALVDQWTSKAPQNLQAAFLAQVALRLEAMEQDDEEALIALLF